MSGIAEFTVIDLLFEVYHLKDFRFLHKLCIAHRMILSLLPSLSLCGLGLVLIALFVTILNCHGFFLGEKTGMMTRVMFTNAIYQKVSSGEVGRR